MRVLNKLIMTLAGWLLIVAAALKFQEMIDTCVPSWRENPTGFWESYEFFLIQIPLEFALGVWMVSGLFRKAAWLAGTLSYFGFIFATLAKLLAGAESCGCFGQVHVDPKITLFAIDIPFFLLLAIFRPRATKLFPPPWPNLAYLLAVFVPTIALMVAAPAAMIALRPDCIKVEDKPDPSAALKLDIFKLNQQLTQKQQEIDALSKAIAELKQAPRSTDEKAFIGVLEIIASDKPNQYEIHIGGKHTLLLNAENLDDIILSIRDSKKQTISVAEAGQIEVTWTEPKIPETTEDTTPATENNQPSPAAVQPWDWLQYVVEDDVREQLSHGLAVVLLYHHDCPVCAEMVPRYSQYYQQMTQQGENAFKIAFLAIPPYSKSGPVPEDTACILGTLTDRQNWQVISPYVVALLDGQKVREWKPGTAPEPEDILNEIFGQ